MGDNQKRIKVDVEATGTSFTLVSGELIASVRDALLDRRRGDIAMTTWASLSENDQKREVATFTEFAEQLVKGIVEVVAAGHYDVIHAKLDNFKIKDGDVTMTSKGRASDGALLALNSVGQKDLKIVVADAEQFDRQREPVPIDVDEPQMNIPDPDEGEANDQGDAGAPDDDGDVLDPETGELTQAVVDTVPRDERKKHAFQAGAGAFAEHGDRDKNPYFEEADDDLREAWNAGFQDAANNQVEDAETVEDDGDNAEKVVTVQGTITTDDDSAPADSGDDWLAEDEDQTEQADPNNPPSESPVSDAWFEGMNARKEGAPKSDNPYEPGQDQVDWNAAYETADKQIGELFRAGQDAAAAGKTMDESGWSDGSFENDTWLLGFTRWIEQNKPEDGE